MADFRYLENAMRFDDELLELLSSEGAEKVAEEVVHPSSGGLARIKQRTPLDDVRDVIARKKGGGDPESKALLASIVTPEKTAELEAFLRDAAPEDT